MTNQRVQQHAGAQKHIQPWVPPAAFLAESVGIGCGSVLMASLFLFSGGSDTCLATPSQPLINCC